MLSGTQTVYQSGTTVYTAPVTLSNGVTLVVLSGATASGVTGVGYNTINVSSGGTLLSSYIPSGVLNVSAGGATSGNTLNQTRSTVFSGGATIGDTWTGASNVYAYSGASVSNATVSSAASIQVQTGATANGVTVSSGASASLAAGTTSSLTVKATGSATSGTATYSGVTISNQPDIDTARVLSGTWSAVLSNGATIYQSGTTIYQWPVTLAAGATLTVMSGAVASRLSGFNQTTINVVSGGTLVSSYLNNGYLNVSAGGTTSANVMDSTLTQILSGGVSNGDTWNNASGAGLDYSVASSGAVVNNPIMGSGGYLSAAAGATVTSPYVSSGGAFVTSAVIGSAVTIPDFMTVPAGATVLSGSWTATVVNGATVYQSGTTTVTYPVALGSNATLKIQSGAIVSGLSAGRGTTITVVSGTLLSSYIDDGIVYVSSGGITSGNAFNSTWSMTSAGGASINDTWFTSGAGRYAETSYISSGATMTGGSVGSGAIVTVVSGGTAKEASVALGGSLNIQNQGANGCFLAGTLIRTDKGEKAVESLEIGDQIVCLKDGIKILRPVKWLGVSKNSFSPSEPLDMAGYPVRVCKNAFGENEPSQDLLVTAEHCFAFDGHFVPVRMLVNGASIFYDKSIPHYEYYHVEIDVHSVIFANNTLSESYLNNGDKHVFTNMWNVYQIRDRVLVWSEDAALPLCVSSEVIEPLYHALARRASMLDYLPVEPVAQLTDEPALALGLHDGRAVLPARKSDGKITFFLPANIRSVTLFSRASRPCDVIGAFHDDRRTLGVLVGQITLFGASQTIDLCRHLTSEAIEGWHESEGPRCRWTTGAARIDLPDAMTRDASILSIEIVNAGPYRVGDVEHAVVQKALKSVA